MLSSIVLSVKILLQCGKESVRAADRWQAALFQGGEWVGRVGLRSGRRATCDVCAAAAPLSRCRIGAAGEEAFSGAPSPGSSSSVHDHSSQPLTKSTMTPARIWIDTMHGNHCQSNSKPDRMND